MGHCGDCTALLSWWWHDTGEIPSSLGQLTKLESLELEFNRLSGKRHSHLALEGWVLCCCGFYEKIIFKTELLAVVHIKLILCCGWVTMVIALLCCQNDGMMQAKFPRVWGSSLNSNGWDWISISCQVRGTWSSFYWWLSRVLLSLFWMMIFKQSYLLT